MGGLMGQSPFGMGKSHPAQAAQTAPPMLLPNNITVRMWGASPREMRSRSALQALLDSPWLLYPQPGTDSQALSIPIASHTSKVSHHHNRGGNNPGPAAPTPARHRGSFPCLTLLYSPGKYIGKRHKQLAENSLQTPFCGFAKAAILHRHRGGFSGSLCAKRCSSHCPSLTQIPSRGATPERFC